MSFVPVPTLPSMRARPLLSALGLVMLTTGAAPARAAESEERLIRQERSVLRQVAKLPADGLDALVWPVKRAVIWAEEIRVTERVYDLLYFNEQRTAGWTPNIDIGGEISGYGLQVFHKDLWGNGERVSLAFLLDGIEVEEQRVDFLLDIPEVAQTGLALRTTIFYQEDEEEDFFVDDEKTEYELDMVTLRLELAKRMLPKLLLGGQIYPVWAKSEPTEKTPRPIPESVPGVGERVFLLGGGLFIELDQRDVSFRPKKGLYTRLDVGFFESLEGEGPNGEDFRFSQYRAEVQFFQPIFRGDRSILVRGLLNRVERAGSDAEVPFWWLPKLDEDNGLRGFNRNRFRDDGALLFNIEYRWPIWDTWDAYGFLDEGQVFDDYSDIALERFEWSAGGGLLLSSVDGFLARVELAFSDEDTIFSFSFKQAF